MPRWLWGWRPPNPASDAFHERLGFVEVGQARLRNGKFVRYLELRVGDLLGRGLRANEMRAPDTAIGAFASHMSRMRTTA